METSVKTETPETQTAPAAESRPGDGLVPRHLHPYRDFHRMRSEFPLCVAATAEGPAVRPLAGVFAEAAEGLGLDGDDAERLRLALLKMEARLREAIADQTVLPLADAWQAHSEAVISSVATGEGARDSLAGYMQEVAARLPEGADLVPFRFDLPARLLAMGTGLRSGDASELRSPVDALIAQLEELLDSRDPAAGRRRAKGYSNGELDPAVLSELLGRLPLAMPLTKQRRTRLKRLGKQLRSLLPKLLGLEKDDPVWTAGVVTDVRAAHEMASARVEALTTFFRSFHEAALEVRDAYSEERHTEFFRHYVPSDEEMAVCPPVLLHLDAGRMPPEALDLLLDLLATRLPVKVLVTIGRLFDDAGRLERGIRPAPRGARLAGMAMGLYSSYVAQLVASSGTLLWRTLEAGIRHTGPALFCVYTGEDVPGGDLHPYLSTAAALESRAFPAFSYDPSRGIDRADRFDLSANPAVDVAWPAPSDDGDDGEPGTAFTLADFLLCDADLARHFTPVGPDRTRAALVPVEEYLGLDGGGTHGKLPVVTAVDREGRSVTLAVSGAVLEAVRGGADYWRSLQETAGIENSFVRRETAALRRQLEAEMQAALEEQEQRHRQEMDLATSRLADEIVGNIAAGLLDLRGAPAAAPMQAPPRPAPPAAPGREAQPEPAAAEAPAPAADEEEEPSFDEPYIDTPLCTTCNECTNINGQMFVYNAEKQAEIAKLSAGTYREMVLAAEKCPVRIIHPGKPWNPSEPGLDELIERAAPFQ